MTTSFAKLLKIHSFPIKGFPGEAIHSVELQPEHGLPQDRNWAVMNGSETVATDGQWHRGKAFVRMGKFPQLCLYQWQRNTQGQLVLQHPQGETLTLDDQNDGSEILKRWFGLERSAIRQRPTGKGFWDHRDGKISIINLTTVKALAKAAKLDIDPTRFRGNLLIETEQPWQELSLIGQTLTIGQARLEILRPIDRCSATSVELSSGELNINMPYLLTSIFGHIYCGLYARVEHGGVIQTKSPIYISGIPENSTIKTHTKPTTLAKAPEWPRAMTVVKRQEESADVSSFYLQEPLTEFVKTNPVGGYIKVHLNSGGQTQYRSYTLSGWSEDGQTRRISVKKIASETGISQYLHQNIQQGDQLIISGPYVNPLIAAQTEQDWQRPILVLTAGIGITVASSVMTYLSQNPNTNSVRFAHVSRSQQLNHLWQEIQKYSESMTTTQTHLYISDKPVNDKTKSHQGHIDLKQVLKDFELEQAMIFLCGPQTFMQSYRAQLIAQGANQERIFQDPFVSPTAIPLKPPKQPIANGPIMVEFKTNSSEQATQSIWQKDQGTLLDLAENHGQNISSSCRSGVCNTCIRRIEGPVEYLRQPLNQPPQGWAHLCCTTPNDNLIVYS